MPSFHDITACPADSVTASAPGQCGAVVTFAAATVTDNCAGATATQASGFTNGTYQAVGLHMVNFSATDAHSNTVECTFIATVNDTETPRITCPAAVVVNNSYHQCYAMVSLNLPTVSDNCGANQLTTVVSQGQASGTLFAVGTLTEGYQTADQAGNMASCVFNVTVKDVEPPTISKNRVCCDEFVLRV